ncbi:hypothetical protein [Metabacillus fastidiosus]|uniref:hypothetical protein n=1 Tax=Metabacillus fastidiosus TaxID=1458 RepID=UPI002DBDCD3F|nr:hypothetical protein [Metabacillus fastidiosus]MEC2074956.1 hypothetical protein [Metabacillus fastidiosus]
MSQNFIVMKPFAHQIDCFCPDSIHAELLTINKQDIIKMTNECKFVDNNGWYSLVIINDESSFYIANEDLDTYVKQEKIISVLDIELKINYLEFCINRSLDECDKASFLKFTKELNNLREFNTILNTM